MGPETPFTVWPIAGADCAAAAITPPDQDFIHTYYDVCPWSPSGQYLLGLRAPFTDHRNGPDDQAEVCLFDLRAQTVRPLWRTGAWGMQRGAQAQWGRSDRYVYFNDRRDNQAVGVRLDLTTGEARRYDGPIWLIDPTETYALSPCVIRTNLTQFGYGMSVASEAQLTNRDPAADDDGFTRMDLASGRRTLLVSLASIWQAVTEHESLDGATLYAFHCKLNQPGTRLMLVARACYPDRRYRPMLMTCRPDGSELRCILPPSRWQGGAGSGHPTWTPNGSMVLMNHSHGLGRRRFCLIDPVTAEARPLIEEPDGTGHPTISPNGQYLLTDSHTTIGDRRPGTVRLVDLREGGWRDLLTVSNPMRKDDPLRCDAHPVWDRTGRLVCFQGTPAAGRRLYIIEPGKPAGQAPTLWAE